VAACVASGKAVIKHFSAFSWSILVKALSKNGFELIASERDELPDAGRFGTDSLRVVSKMIADAQAVENPAHQGNQAVA